MLIGRREVVTFSYKSLPPPLHSIFISWILDILRFVLVKLVSISIRERASKKYLGQKGVVGYKVIVLLGGCKPRHFFMGRHFFLLLKIWVQDNLRSSRQKAQVHGFPLSSLSLIPDYTGRAGGGVSLKVVCCGEFVEIRTNQNIVGVAHLYRKHCTSYT